MTAQELRHPPGRYRLRVGDYAMLDATGAFDGARTELIEGDVIVMSPQYRPHGIAKLGLYNALRSSLQALRSPLTAVVEFSLALDEHNLPEPDIMLTSEPIGEGAVPLASVALVIEVADTTLDTDLGAKARLYSAAGVREYWVADINGGVIHQMWAPNAETYGKCRKIAFGETVAAATIDRLSIVTARLRP